MTAKSKRSAWIALVVWTLMAIPPARAGLLSQLCSPDADPPPAIEVLVEEAEATGMPPSVLNRLLIVGYRDRHSVMEMRRLLCRIIVAEERGLPPDSLFEKVAEGLGKRAPLDQILAVVGHRIETLQQAQQLLAGEDPLPLDSVYVDRIADLPVSSLPPDTLARLFGSDFTAAPAMRVIAAEILAYATVLDFPPERLQAIVQTGLAHHALTPEWTYFIKVVQQARKQNIGDATIARAALHTLAHGEPIGELIELLGIAVPPVPAPQAD